MYKSNASAPGKAILFGEHAVVYGIPAIAAALSDLRIYVSMETNNSSTLSIVFEDLNFEDGSTIQVDTPFDKIKEYIPLDANEDSLNPNKPTEEVQAVLKGAYDNFPSAASQGTIAVVYLVGKILMKHTEELTGLIVKVRSQGLPIGAGLGSSAAFSVATSASCWQLEHRLQLIDTENKSNLTLDKVTLSKINAWAFMAEILIHGTPSGLDNTTATFGGMLKFKKLENGNEFINLDQIPNNLQILLTNTRVPRSTKVLVAGVRALYNDLPTVVQPIFLSVEEVTNTFTDTLVRHQQGEFDAAELVERLSKLIKVNHHLMNAVGVGHPALTTVVQISEEFGHAGKLTGAGGGGCAITLLSNKQSEDESQQLIEKLKSQGFEVFQSSIGGDGVRVF